MYVPPKVSMLLKSNFRESLPDVADVKQYIMSPNNKLNKYQGAKS